MREWPKATAVDDLGLTLGGVTELLDAESLVSGDPKTPVRAIGAADLMSDVLALGRPGMLLLTGLATAQAVRTASVADLAAIVFVRDKPVSDDVLALARESRVPVLRTRLTMFEASGRLYAAVEDRRAT
ncbi:MAG TPA: DRTGG domain-containing protein [Gemmatimonadaceae bacterium]|nr:DRTGG domain-containing protein [Gemmatimonadaceae bacterium]